MGRHFSACYLAHLRRGWRGVSGRGESAERNTCRRKGMWPLNPVVCACNHSFQWFHTIALAEPLRKRDVFFNETLITWQCPLNEISYWNLYGRSFWWKLVQWRDLRILQLFSSLSQHWLTPQFADPRHSPISLRCDSSTRRSHLPLAYGSLLWSSWGPSRFPFLVRLFSRRNPQTKRRCSGLGYKCSQEEGSGHSLSRQIFRQSKKRLIRG